MSPPTFTKSIRTPTSSRSIIAAIGRRPARLRPKRCLPTRRWSTISRSSGCSRRGRSRSASASARRRRAACRQRPLDGLILVTPFDSLKAVAQGLYPWLPIGPFFQPRDRRRGGAAGQQGAGRDHRRRAGRPHLARADRRPAAAGRQPRLRPDHPPRRPQRHLQPIRFQRCDAATRLRHCQQTETVLAGGLAPIHILEIKGAIARGAVVKTPAELIVR